MLARVVVGGAGASTRGAGVPRSRASTASAIGQSPVRGAPPSWLSTGLHRPPEPSWSRHTGGIGLYTILPMSVPALTSICWSGSVSGTLSPNDSSSVVSVAEAVAEAVLLSVSVALDVAVSPAVDVSSEVAPAVAEAVAEAVAPAVAESPLVSVSPSVAESEAEPPDGGESLHL